MQLAGYLNNSYKDKIETVKKKLNLTNNSQFIRFAVIHLIETIDNMDNNKK